MNKTEQFSKKSRLRNILRIWLIEHPKFNPYEIKKVGLFRAFTSPFRILPDFLIIGAGKCGTTSLYNNMIEHPCIFSASKKEIKFFSRNIRGLYRSYFPTIFQKKIQTWYSKKPFLTGEASTEYILSEEAAKRIHKIIPNVKLLVILRNPVDRAYSHYNDLVTYQKEKRSFEEVVESHISKLKENKGLTNNFDFRNPNVISTGFYVNQLELWMNYFPKQQFLILKTEDFKNDPQKVLDNIFEFLNLPTCKIPKIIKHNVGTYKKLTMEPTIRSKLLEYFLPYNEQLSKLLGVEFDWKK